MIAVDKPAPFTFQALSDEDRKLWLDAMDGKEPVSQSLIFNILFIGKCLK